MTILLGYLQTPSNPQRDARQEKRALELEYKERWNVARRQLSAMRVYLYYVNKFFAAQLVKSGKHRFRDYIALANYIHSETDALGLGSEMGMKAVGHGSKKYFSPPYPTLSVDLQKARRLRGGLRVSWVFERLHELSRHAVFVQVWDASHSHKQIGAETKYESQKDKDQHFEAVDYAWVKIFYRDPRKPTAPLDKRGETYVHELIIHAWRHAKFGAIDPGYRYMSHQKKNEAHRAHLYYIYGHHRGGAAHVLDDKSLPHSLADIEADLLWYYIMGREQLDPKSKRPRHARGEFNRLTRRIGGPSLMCEKYCRPPEPRSMRPGIHGSRRSLGR